jgi:hypothetical protein
VKESDGKKLLRCVNSAKDEGIFFWGGEGGGLLSICPQPSCYCTVLKKGKVKQWWLTIATIRISRAGLSYMLIYAKACAILVYFKEFEISLVLAM